MPKTAKSGKPKKSELPSTLLKSGKKAQRTFTKTYDSAMDQYQSSKRAHRVAFDALKHSFERVGDRWEAKGKRGPSDERAKSGGPNAKGKSASGVDANASKKHLLNVARRLDIKGRSTMRKSELVTAIKKENKNKTARKSSSRK